MPPSRLRCYEILGSAGILHHILRHSLQVCRVALCLSDALISSGRRVDRDLVEAGALLHDVTKTRSIQTGERHADTGAAHLAGLGFPDVAEVVRQHVRLDDPALRAVFSPAGIVNYADKRVLHDEIVPLEERMAYIVTRYGANPDLKARLQEIWDHTREMERTLFTPLSFDPDDLASRLEPDGLARMLAEYGDGNALENPAFPVAPRPASDSASEL